jgi:hypothetical protein
MKDPDKVLVPSSNLILIALREHRPENHIPFTSFFYLPPYLTHGSVIESVSVARRLHRWSDSRGQISNRIQDGLGEFVQLSPPQPPVEHLTNIAAIPPEVDVVPIVGHGILNRRESTVHLRGGVGETDPDHS